MLQSSGTNARPSQAITGPFRPQRLVHGLLSKIKRTKLIHFSGQVNPGGTTTNAVAPRRFCRFGNQRPRARAYAGDVVVVDVDEVVRSNISLQCRRIFEAGALNNPSLLSSWERKRERAGASQK